MKPEEWYRSFDGIHHRRFGSRLYGMVVPSPHDETMWESHLRDNGWPQFGVNEYDNVTDAKRWCEWAAEKVLAKRKMEEQP